ncbi:MAG: cyclic nucleotide-binding domain-containing protein [Spirochaetia bacterium]|nr:cyclic nucleotide-binding domain-containing protein [Spirochaetia bacterium]
MAVIDLKGIGKPVFYKGGEILYEEDDNLGDPCIYYIVEGKIEVVKNYNTLQKELFSYGDGDIFGMLEVFAPSRRVTHARALSDVKAVGMNKDEFEQAMIASMNFTLTSIRLQSKMLRQINDRIKKLPDK